MMSIVTFRASTRVAILAYPHVVPSFIRINRPTSVVWNPVPPLIPTIDDAASVTPVPVAAPGVSVVAVVLTDR